MKKLIVLLLFLTTKGNHLYAQANSTSPSHLKMLVNSNNTVVLPFTGSYFTYPDIAPNLTGSGIHLFHISMDSTAEIKLSGMPMFYGKFRWEGGVNEIGIDSGMAISSGWTPNINGPNAPYYTIPGGNSGIPWPAKYNAGANYPGGNSPVSFGGLFTSRWEQFPELVALNHGDSIAEAVILEFDFIPDSNHIALDYVFASEEYPNMNDSSYPSTVCDTPNDVMGIFLSGPGITGEQNIALIPGTDIPVGVNTITPPGWNCNGMPDYSQYYVDNTGGQNVIYNGFTTVLTAQAKVIPGATYHLKIGVADGARHPETTDTLPAGWGEPLLGFYDSGIFLKFGSFRSYHAEDTTNGIGSTAVHLPGISISPNPFSKDFQLYSKTPDNQIYHLQLTDMTGRRQMEIKGNTRELNRKLKTSTMLKHIPSGIYVLTLINKQTNVRIRYKLVKQE